MSLLAQHENASLTHKAVRPGSTCLVSKHPGKINL